MSSEALSFSALAPSVNVAVAEKAPSVMSAGNSVGMTTTSTLGNGIGKPTVQVETDSVQDVQRVLQWNIDNSQAGNARQLLRFGSIAGVKDAYVGLGLTASAADNNVIADENGAGCKKIQAFSKFVSFKPVITSKFKVICEEVTQLTQNLKHCRLQMDGSQPLTATINMAYTQSLSDNRTNLVYVDVAKVLDSTQYFEYVIEAGVKLAVFIEIAGFSNNETFTPLLGVN